MSEILICLKCNGEFHIEQARVRIRNKRLCITCFLCGFPFTASEMSKWCEVKKPTVLPVPNSTDDKSKEGNFK